MKVVSLRRWWGTPLWVHVLALAGFLLVLIPVIGTSYSLSPDEAVAMTQARSLARGGGWIVEHPVPDLDPRSEFYPISESSRGDDGIAPFAKHPLYPLALAALDRVGGTAAMVFLSVLGTVAASALAALLARQVIGGFDRPVLWVVGLGSPLLFDAYLLIAHSVGAALATAAVLLTVKALRAQRLRYLIPSVMVLLFAAVLMRSEALIFALALGVALSAAGVTNRRWSLVGGGMAVGAAGVVAALLEKQWQVALIGSDQTMLGLPAAEGGFWEARLAGVLNTWLRPTVGELSGASLLLVVVAILAVAGVIVLRFRPQRPEMLLLLGLGAVALTAVALVEQPDRVVPGLLVAFPVSVFAVGLLDRRSFDPSGRLVLTITSLLFILGVLATQYPQGGSAEWGGRYFALTVPVLTVLAVDGLARWSSRLPAIVRVWGSGALVLCAAMLSVGALASLGSHHRANQRTLATFASVAATTSPGDGGAPVVVTAWANIARLAWPNHSDDRWLLTSDDERGDDLAGRLARDGIRELVLVGKSDDEVKPYLGHYAVDDRRSVELVQWDAVVLAARP